MKPTNLVGERLRSEMLARLMTQAELAQRLGVSRSLVFALLRGRRTVSADVALRLEMVFGGKPTALDWLTWDNIRRTAEARKKLEGPR